MNIRPRIGAVSLLVYRECPCGKWLATGEGSVHPLCPECNEPFLPCMGEFRRSQGLGFAALFTSEMGAVRLVRRLRDLIGLLGDDGRTLTVAAVVASEHGDGPFFVADRREPVEG